jgi:hypothetical protein
MADLPAGKQVLSLLRLPIPPHGPLYFVEKRLKV